MTRILLVETAIDGNVAPPLWGWPDGPGTHGAAVVDVLTTHAPDVPWFWFAVCDETGVWKPEDALDAVLAAIEPGDIVLVELQGEGGQPLDFHDEAAHRFDAMVARGAVVVLPAGNGGKEIPEARSKAVLVGALNRSGRADQRSCFGDAVTVWAEGTQAAGLSGTSRAAALYAARSARKDAELRLHARLSEP